MVLGRFALSRSHFEEVLALYDPISHGSLVYQDGDHPHVNSQAGLGMVLFCLGFPDQALAHNSAATAEARRLAHLPFLAASLAIGTRVLFFAGDDAALNEQTNELAAMTTEWGFPQWGAQGTIHHGWLKVKSGDVADGMSLLHSGLASYRATGAEMGVPYQLGLLAKACESAGQIEEAMTQLDEALQIVERTGERRFAAELNRHKASCCCGKGISRPARNRIRKPSASPESRRPSSGNCAPP
jgi:predicted ATPase